jgi:hypothetical protein
MVWHEQKLCFLLYFTVLYQYEICGFHSGDNEQLCSGINLRPIG